MDLLCFSYKISLTKVLGIYFLWYDAAKLRYTVCYPRNILRRLAKQILFVQSAFSGWFSVYQYTSGNLFSLEDVMFASLKPELNE